jgi:hypothetical protein
MTRSLIRICLVAASLGIVIAARAANASNWPHSPLESLPICTEPEAQYHPRIAPDGVGGAIIVWQDFRASHDIYAQRVDAYGNVLWDVDGVPICSELDSQKYPEIISDGSGGAIIAWYDGRNGSDYDIYAQRISSDADILWAVGGTPVCTESGDQAWPRLTSDGAGGAIIAWYDIRSGEYDIYVQRVDAYGDTCWTANGIPVCAVPSQKYDHRLVSDGEGGAAIVWFDMRSGESDIYAQHLDQSGNTLWAPDGLPICTEAEYQVSPRIASDASGGFLIAWDDDRSPGRGLYAQRIAANGDSLWTPGGVPVYQTLPTYTPEMVTDGSGGAVIAWYVYDSGSATFDIYAQRIDGDGNILWGADAVPICVKERDQVNVQLVSDGPGGAVIVWHDYGEGGYNYDIYAQRVDHGGTLLWTTNGVPIATKINDEMYPYLVSDKCGGAIITWYEWQFDIQWQANIYAQRVEANGYLGYPSPDIVSLLDYPQDQGGQVILSWQASYLDAYPYQLITGYSIWRRYQGGAQALKSLGSAAIQEDSEGTDGMPLARAVALGMDADLLTLLAASGWEYLVTLPAAYLDEYAYTAPTYADSTGSGTNYTGFMVIAHTSEPWSFWTSSPDSGYSMDNLAPNPPADPTMTSPTELAWYEVPEEDLDYYTVSGSSMPELDSTAVFIGHTTDTTMSVLEHIYDYYHITATDYAGNESPGSSTSNPYTGIHSGDKNPTTFALGQNRPNPFGPETVIPFQLPVPGRVTLCVYDVEGRVVRILSNERYSAGRHSVTWHGDDGKGHRVGTGVYFVRIEAGGFRDTRKMLLLQ